MEIAIKGGGHGSTGDSSTNGGVVIDLSRYMNAIAVDTTNKIAVAQMGATVGGVGQATMAAAAAAGLTTGLSPPLGGVRNIGSVDYVTRRQLNDLSSIGCRHWHRWPGHRGWCRPPLRNRWVDR